MEELQAVEARMQGLIGPQQFATLGPMVRAHLSTGGKRLRARLALGAARLLGAANMDAAIDWACACELMHNATLVHDDLQDGDTVRRGAPTLWVAHGSAQAINAGDLMLMAPFDCLHRSGLDPHLIVRLGGILAQGMMSVIEGQAQECALTALGQGDVATYTAMIRGKTAALFALPVRGAAALSGHTDADAEALAGAFVPLGELFQMQDDVLDLWGQKGRDLVGSDLYEGKISALVVYHLDQCPEDGAWLGPLLLRHRQDTDAKDVAHAIERFVASGARARVLERIDALAAEAMGSVDGRLKSMLQQLIEQVMAPIAHVLRPEAAS